MAVCSNLDDLIFIGGDAKLCRRTVDPAVDVISVNRRLCELSNPIDLCDLRDAVREHAPIFNGIRSLYFGSAAVHEGDM